MTPPALPTGPRRRLSRRRRAAVVRDAAPPSLIAAAVAAVNPCCLSLPSSTPRRLAQTQLGDLTLSLCADRSQNRSPSGGSSGGHRVVGGDYRGGGGSSVLTARHCQHARQDLPRSPPPPPSSPGPLIYLLESAGRCPTVQQTEAPVFTVSVAGAKTT